MPQMKMCIGRTCGGKWIPVNGPARCPRCQAAHAPTTARAKRTRGRAGGRLRRLILERDGYRCTALIQVDGETKRCSCRTGLEVDHKVPIEWGGTDLPSNLVTLCQDCHAAKTRDERQRNRRRRRS